MAQCLDYYLRLDLVGFLWPVAYLYVNLLSHLHTWQSYLRLRNAINSKHRSFRSMLKPGLTRPGQAPANSKYFHPAADL